MFEEKKLKKIIESSLKETFKEVGIVKETDSKSIKETDKKVSGFLREALISTPKEYLLKTQHLSPVTKNSHEILYKNYIKSFNEISSKLDAANKSKASPSSGDFRNLKKDETFNLNAIKLHELYFSNISDLDSEISVDSLPYIKLARDFGTFENGQFDFIATCMSSRNGWGLVVFEPFHNKYMNIVVDGHTKGIPLNCIPVLVIDMWEHAYFKDYYTDKKNYITSMMKELNWDVVEARMNVVESINLDTLYKIKPLVNDEPEKILKKAAGDVKNAVNASKAKEEPGLPTAPTGPSQTPAPQATTLERHGEENEK